MKKNFCTVVFDRKRKLEKLGYGKVEVHIKLPLGIRKYVTVKECGIKEWMAYQKSKELAAIVAEYESIVCSMVTLGEELTRENLDAHLYGYHKEDTPDPLQESFLEFMDAQIDKQDIAKDTKRQHRVALRCVREFGKIKVFADLTPANIQDLDAFIRKLTNIYGKPITGTTVDNYHKRIHKYVRMAYEREIISRDPYDSVKIVHGKNKERHALLETEMVKIRDAEMPTQCLERVRDLFVFAAYTGLAYIDVMNFDFFTMTEQNGDLFYIDGKRTKTGSEFYTPILPPAMEVLKKYKFSLPIISNQKVNLYLHGVQANAGVQKRLTFHIARHTFATMVLSHDVPIEKLARMLGHKDVKTTQIYGRVLKSTIHSHADRLMAEML